MSKATEKSFFTIKAPAGTCKASTGIIYQEVNDLAGIIDIPQKPYRPEFDLNLSQNSNRTSLHQMCRQAISEIFFSIFFKKKKLSGDGARKSPLNFSPSFCHGFCLLCNKNHDKTGTSPHL